MPPPHLGGGTPRFIYLEFKTVEHNCLELKIVAGVRTVCYLDLKRPGVA